MHPDKKNNQGNEEHNTEEQEEEEDDDDDDDDEPAFKFSTITVASGLRKNTDNSGHMPAEFSCIAVHEKFLVIGKLTGEILITDHLGHIIPQYQIRAVRNINN